MKPKKRKNPVTFAEAAAKIRKERAFKPKNKSLGYEPTNKPFKSRSFNPFQASNQ